MTAPTVLNVYPASSALGIPIGDSVTVQFDQEMDELSINSGTLVLIAPANDVVFGPGLEPLEQQTAEDAESILDTPTYSGYVKGTITFSRVNTSGGIVDDDEVDYDGVGNLWYTIATLTPSQPLKPNVTYTAIVLGDETQTNDFDSGVRTRSVFDAEPVSVSGTGIPIFIGSYTGTSTRTYVLEITSGGATGAATYEWWNEATPLEVYEGVTTTGYRELEDGVIVYFDPDGSFTTGDKWQVVVKPYSLLANNYRWEFTTGSGSILTPPSSSSASGIGTIGAAAGTDTTGLYVSEITPSEGEYGVEISTDPYTGETITIVFNNDLDASTVTEDSISIYTESPNGDTSIASITGDLDFTAAVSGDTISIELDPGQLYQNNIIVIKLDKDIADEDGVTLGEEYISYFATTYTPLYAGIRQIQLEYGASFPSTMKDETIYLAILEASLEVDAISYVTTIANVKLFNIARQNYATCLAARKLLSGAGLGSEKMSKRLGDLTVSRDTGGADIRNELADCIAYWEIAVQSGGGVAPDTSLPPQYTVKGVYADDWMPVGRLWEPTNRIGSYRGSANSSEYRSYRRQWRTHNTRYNRGGS